MSLHIRGGDAWQEFYFSFCVGIMLGGGRRSGATSDRAVGKKLVDMAKDYVLVWCEFLTSANPATTEAADRLRRKTSMQGIPNLR
jgi:hypothetical protein